MLVGILGGERWLDGILGGEWWLDGILGGEWWLDGILGGERWPDGSGVMGAALQPSSLLLSPPQLTHGGGAPKGGRGPQGRGMAFSACRFACGIMSRRTCSIVW